LMMLLLLILLLLRSVRLPLLCNNKTKSSKTNYTCEQRQNSK
jgi:hypothetical protein